MSMGLLILGLVIFLGVHSLGMTAPAWRERTVARLGEVPWKGIYSVASLVGFVLIVWGYGAARTDPVVLWHPPVWLRHLALLVMIPAFPLLLAAYLPGQIQNAVKHPMLAAVKVWAVAHLLANGNLTDLLLFGSFLTWAVADRISLRTRTGPPVQGAPPGKANDLIALIGGLALYGAFIGGLHAWLIGVSPLGMR
jgi:uncharacterized membrane protein